MTFGECFNFVEPSHVDIFGFHFDKLGFIDFLIFFDIFVSFVFFNRLPYPQMASNGKGNAEDRG